MFLKLKMMSSKRYNKIWPVILVISTLMSVAQAETQAQGPGTYRVINVRPGSALNVRAQDSSSSEDIGSASLGLELHVVEFNANSSWAKVKWEDGFGWVSTRFLSAEGTEKANLAALAAIQRQQKQPKFEPKQLAAAAIEEKQVPSTAALVEIDASKNPSISCSGNGPNWALSVNKFGSLVFQAPDQNSLYATTQWRQAIGNEGTYAFAVADVKGTLLRKACIDKRSNQTLQWQLDLQTNGFGGQDRLSGCCTSTN